MRWGTGSFRLRVPAPSTTTCMATGKAARRAGHGRLAHALVDHAAKAFLAFALRGNPHVKLHRADRHRPATSASRMPSMPRASERLVARTSSSVSSRYACAAASIAMQVAARGQPCPEQPARSHVVAMAAEFAGHVREHAGAVGMARFGGQAACPACSRGESSCRPASGPPLAYPPRAAMQTRCPVCSSRISAGGLWAEFLIQCARERT